MIAEVGRFLVALALILSALQLAAGWRAAGTSSPIACQVAGRAAQASMTALMLAFALLIHLFLVSDFSVAYVAGHSHVDKPLLYKVAAAWGGHEGSMLLWCLLLTAVGAGLARFGPRSDEGLRLRAVSIQGGLQLLFLGFLVFTSNPFDRLADVPLQGADLNPILQDPALALHPPMLYLGYVGISAAYSLALAGLIEGRGGQVVARALRPWAVGAWVALTAGISLGAWWAYYELGWGGWWFWDPVENASFMPWLVTAALIHSAIATQRTGAFPGWTALLALLAFSMSALGAFLVRSGVLTSVHTFALDPERGLWILAILAVLAGGGLAIFGCRAAKLGEGEGFEPTSREAFIGLNNLFLAVTAGVVLCGTIYPLLADALGWRAVSVGAPYFNRAATPLMAVLLILIPFAPYLPWRGGGLKRTAISWRPLVWLVPGAAAGLGVLLAGGSLLAVAGAAVGGWALGGAVTDIFESRALAGLAPRLSAFGRGLAHAGVGLIALGAAADSTGQAEQVRALAPGEVMTLGGRSVALASVRRADGSNYLADQAELIVTENGRRIGVIFARP